MPVLRQHPLDTRSIAQKNQKRVNTQLTCLNPQSRPHGRPCRRSEGQSTCPELPRCLWPALPLSSEVIQYLQVCRRRVERLALPCSNEDAPAEEQGACPRPRIERHPYGSNCSPLPCPGSKGAGVILTRRTGRRHPARLLGASNKGSSEVSGPSRRTVIPCFIKVKPSTTLVCPVLSQVTR